MGALRSDPEQRNTHADCQSRVLCVQQLCYGQRCACILHDCSCLLCSPVQVVIDVTNPWQSDYAKLAACTFAPNLTCDIDDVEHSKDVDSARDSRSSSERPSLDNARDRDQVEPTWRSKGDPSTILCCLRAGLIS